jgi:hypothetical protein
MGVGGTVEGRGNLDLAGLLAEAVGIGVSVGRGGEAAVGVLDFDWELSVVDYGVAGGEGEAAWVGFSLLVDCTVLGEDND